jgi:hypothetical protein
MEWKLTSAALAACSRISAEKDVELLLGEDVFVEMVGGR